MSESGWELGLSDPDMVSWGRLLFVAQDYMDSAWWMSLFPGAAPLGGLGMIGGWLAITAAAIVSRPGKSD